jgi:hypothetical protein
MLEEGGAHKLSHKSLKRWRRRLNGFFCPGSSAALPRERRPSGRDRVGGSGGEKQLALAFLLPLFGSEIFCSNAEKAATGSVYVLKKAPSFPLLDPQSSIFCSSEQKTGFSAFDWLQSAGVACRWCLAGGVRPLMAFACAGSRSRERRRQLISYHLIESKINGWAFPSSPLFH